jgi:hypothetical protein
MFREILRFSRESKGGRIQKVKNMLLNLIKKKGGREYLAYVLICSFHRESIHPHTLDGIVYNQLINK